MILPSLSVKHTWAHRRVARLSVHVVINASVAAESSVHWVGAGAGSNPVLQTTATRGGASVPIAPNGPIAINFKQSI